ncbi:MAG: cytidine deaminase [Sphaerochaetaceae bacterium]
MIKGIIFDVDGVIIDSEEYTCLSAIELFQNNGVKVKAKDFEPFVGAGEDSYIGEVAKKYGLKLDLETSKKEMYEIYRQFALGLRKGHTKLNAKEGVVKLISQLTSNQIKIAVATSADYIKAKINLATVGFDEDDFNFFISGSNLKRKKPFSDIYTFSALSLNLSPEQCLVIEDSPSGIVSAKNAGCACLGVEGTFKRDLLIASGADLVVSNLDDFPIEALLKDKLDGIFEQQTDEYLKIKAISKAWKAFNNSYSPYSHFKVGAALITSTKNIYSGCNVENSSYGGTICAERSAIMQAIANEGKILIDYIVVVSDDKKPAPPCAICLQVINEFALENTQVVLISANGVINKFVFKELLPHPFNL